MIWGCGGDDSDKGKARCCGPMRKGFQVVLLYETLLIYDQWQRQTNQRSFSWNKALAKEAVREWTRGRSVPNKASIGCSCNSNSDGWIPC